MRSTQSQTSRRTLHKRRRPAPQEHVFSARWLFGSKSARRTPSSWSLSGSGMQRRSFFGLGEIFGVITNPAGTVRSLTESKRLLEETHQQITENKEHPQIIPKHTFTRLPSFYPRPTETAAIERILEDAPCFTVVFGGSSVGKTALLREVLSKERYHVLHFDLRIPGFADVTGLYMSLSQQMEQFFEDIASQMPGYEDFQKEARVFKHDRLKVERHVKDAPNGSNASRVRVSDIARLMERFQSSLLRYCEFTPEVPEGDAHSPATGDAASERTRVGTPASRLSFRRKLQFLWRRSKPPEPEPPQYKIREIPPKKIPVIFFDEAHNRIQVQLLYRPLLVKSADTMKCLLDVMLVLTKQDRLCHVIHATSDPFYSTWLRQLNVIEHCKILTIGDCSKSETRGFFHERLLPTVPERLHSRLDFEHLYHAFGGKLTFWQDHVKDFGEPLLVFPLFTQDSHFLQAHALLNLSIVHALGDGRSKAHESTATLHPGHAHTGTGGFKIDSPDGPDTDAVFVPPFTAMELIRVMRYISASPTPFVSYFALCREFRARAIDGMIAGKILDLRWNDAVTYENMREEFEFLSGRRAAEATRILPEIKSLDDFGSPVDMGSPGEIGSPVELGGPVEEYGRGIRPVEADGLSEELNLEIGPKCLPATPIVRYAMAHVLQEYDQSDSQSEYVSLSDVEEY
ncbi:hypothetical protein FISHEDRAFT_40955 [Fistulina hepatica ATCC 64428]|uniref:AAA+ ATPase domain-containing protein n=1 Tax=Fistulina hepatica ATCC 64428 TaxID=1128425 RepID=A0A0D7AHN9_9AGAR|nr:hypothetical protein FISHEDRAFT_40955 [Fistulina hepatica ATCC 64428]